MEAIENANEWFKLQNINTFIDNESLYFRDKSGFEFELSKEEINYRSELLADSRKNIAVDFENKHEVKDHVLNVLIPQINAEIESDYQDDEEEGAYEIIDGLSEVIYTYQARKISEAFDVSPFDLSDITGERFGSFEEMAYEIILEAWREENN